MNDPTVNSLILDKLTTLDKALNRRLDDTEGALNDRLDLTEKNLTLRLDQQDHALAEIKQQTTATNGRVTVVERTLERVKGFVFAFRWIPVMTSVALTAAVTVGLTLIFR